MAGGCALFGSNACLLTVTSHDFSFSEGKLHRPVLASMVLLVKFTSVTNHTELLISSPHTGLVGSAIDTLYIGAALSLWF